MNFQTYQYTFAKVYITAIAYGDYSALSLSDNEEEEIALVDAFVAALPRTQPIGLNSLGSVGYFAWPDNEDTDFSRCEISGLMADCVTVDYSVAI